MTTALAAVPVIWVLAGATVDAADGLELSFDNGTVTLVASEVPVSDILSEWARIGSTRFVDAEDLADGSPLTLQLTDVPEAEALELLLRAAAGYLAAPRAVRVDGASRFDRVLIMATSSGPPMTPSFGGPTAGDAGFRPHTRLQLRTRRWRIRPPEARTRPSKPASPNSCSSCKSCCNNRRFPMARSASRSSPLRTSAAPNPGPSPKRLHDPA